MKLYTVPVSPNCRRAEATVYHLNLDVEIITKSFNTGELGKSEFLEINPNGKVPVLVDGDFILWESNAIMQYLADKSSKTDFFPQDFTKRADIVRWQFWESQHFNKAVGGICWETVAKPLMKLGDPDSSIIQSALTDFHKYAKILDQQLAGKKFIFGETLTLADFSVGCHSALALFPASQVPLTEYPNIGDWYKRLENTPAWAKTRPEFS